ncbi:MULTISPECIES: phosphatase PAP2 family protein [unclassified Lentimicrobium]|uniref:phosphatase PAP2 family protein n=1 Tax=unclassified Lentimicrobium TaxID=2677434 RepID=UPI0015556737|nr:MULTISPECIES: phosphatase PAP2 family protein [unclassified Lentimicrobium]NPD45407.1 phosphatase PAP2 family protein [Lentimicrobium sp. S6]NPD84894.1 phosphatase PAP2 family protein [Lentimicrobium sp. L6]
MAKTKRIDILFFAYLSISTLFLLISSGNVQNIELLIGLRVLLVPAIFALIYFSKKNPNPFLRLLRNTYPLIISGYFYSETVNYNKLFFDNLDPYLVKTESAIFGIQPSIEFSGFFSNLLFSELMYMGYFSFYLLIVFFILYVYFKKRDYFKEAVFKLTASLYIFYFIFCLFPSAGPQFHFSPPESILPNGFLFKEIMDFIQKMAEKPTGAFPSSHVGISIIILILSKKRFPPFFKMAWPFVIILIFSTVYIKAHYAIDIIGGLLIAPIILYLSDFSYQIPPWNQQKSNTQVKLDHD